MSRFRVRLAALAASVFTLAVSGGCDGVLGSDPPEPGSVLFEVEYVNFAWGLQWQGLFVDGEGNVYSFRRTTPWEPADWESFTEAELADKYSQEKHLVATLSAGEVRARYRLVEAASHGRIERRQAAADAGAKGYRAYRYDAARGRYTPVELRVEGDWHVFNHSPEADALYEWLRDVEAVD